MCLCQAAVEDEDKFKQTTEELKELCKSLMMNKADKIAVIELNERLNTTKVIRDELQGIRSELGSKVGKQDLSSVRLPRIVTLNMLV